jgi:acetolactate synthase-1/2/3 large subunit
MKKKKESTPTRKEESIAPRSGAQCVIDGLVEAGCEMLFGYPGGTVLDIFNCLYEARSTWPTAMPGQQGSLDAA